MSKGNSYTAYIVRDSNSRRYLNQKIYTGRKTGIWGRMGEANIFSSESQAQSCASNINDRRPYGYSAYQAEVVPVRFQGRKM